MSVCVCSVHVCVHVSSCLGARARPGASRHRPQALPDQQRWCPCSHVFCWFLPSTSFHQFRLRNVRSAQDGQVCAIWFHESESASQTKTDANGRQCSIPSMSSSSLAAVFLHQHKRRPLRAGLSTGTDQPTFTLSQPTDGMVQPKLTGNNLTPLMRAALTASLLGMVPVSRTCLQWKVTSQPPSLTLI